MNQLHNPIPALVVDEEPDDKVQHKPLHECVKDALEGYFAILGEGQATGLYQMVIQEVERPMLEAVMKRADDNQTRAAEMLGINRGTLRKKLKQYGLSH
jgi:Fis family transcriptional regulator